MGTDVDSITMQIRRNILLAILRVWNSESYANFTSINSVENRAPINGGEDHARSIAGMDLVY
jgi:hypothetical protein